MKNIFTHNTAFIPFLMAGDPSIATTIDTIITLAKSGCDLIELGVPFSDPVADGPINQKSAENALKNGVTVTTVLTIVSEVRARGYTIPIIVFSYYNPLFSMGIKTFTQQAVAAGVDGILIVDLPPEEGEDIYTHCREAGLGVVLLASPTTEPARLALYNRLQPAFIYYISRCGVTGVQDALSQALEKEVTTLRTLLTPGQKIVVGFGISTIAQAKQVAAFADGVVVGSHLVKMLAEEGVKAVGVAARAFVTALREINPLC